MHYSALRSASKIQPRRLRAYVFFRRAMIYALTGVLRRPQVRPHSVIHEAVHASINWMNYKWDEGQADRCRDPSPESRRHSGIHRGRLSGRNSGKPLLLCTEESERLRTKRLSKAALSLCLLDPD